LENKVEKLRNLNNEKQEELANIVGVSRQTIISIEKGKYNPSIILAFKIAKHYGKSIEEVFIYEEEEKNEKK
jgi:putative transcriptional regulator